MGLSGGLATNGGTPAAGGGGISQATADGRYSPQWPNLVAPPGAVHPIQFSTGAALASLTPRGVRVIVPKSGTLHDVSWFITAQSGNVAAAIYDTGDASAGNRSLLASSGSMVVAASLWQSWDPALAVTAGQQLDFCLMADNATAAFARLNGSLANANLLPTGFNPVPGGALPKLIFQIPTVGSLTSWSATVAEANVTTPNTSSPVLIARVA